MSWWLNYSSYFNIIIYKMRINSGTQHDTTVKSVLSLFNSCKIYLYNFFLFMYFGFQSSISWMKFVLHHTTHSWWNRCKYKIEIKWDKKRNNQKLTNWIWIAHPIIQLSSWLTFFKFFTQLIKIFVPCSARKIFN